MKLGGNVYPVRTSRITGQTEVFWGDNWGEFFRQNVSFKLEDVRKIEGHAQTRTDNYVGRASKQILHLSVYTETVKSTNLSPEVKNEVLHQFGYSPDKYDIDEKSLTIVPIASNWSFHIVEASGR